MSAFVAVGVMQESKYSTLISRTSDNGLKVADAVL